MTPREPQSPRRSQTADLAEYLRLSGPLNSNPGPLTSSPRPLASSSNHTSHTPGPLNPKTGPLSSNPLPPEAKPPRPFSSSSARPDSTVLPSNYAMPFKVRGTVPLNLPISQEKRASMLPWSEQQSQASPGATNDSAYASGSEPAAPHDASDAAALSPDGSETVTKPSSRMRLFPDTTDARPSSPYPPSASGRSKSSGERKGASLTPPTSEAPPSTGVVRSATDYRPTKSNKKDFSIRRMFGRKNKTQTVTV